jgi:hypothetical protein
MKDGALFVARRACGVDSNLDGGREIVTDPSSFLWGN